MTVNDKKPKTAALTYENWYSKTYPHIVGIDEAGRGAWAGPVSAGAVCLPVDIDNVSELLAGVRDSKEMTPRQRERLVENIQQTALAWGVGSASNDEIDFLGIVPATKLAMVRAVEDMMRRFDGFEPGCLFLDSMSWEDCPFPYERINIRKGDKHSLSIAAGSVIAKVWRDNFMRTLEHEYPGYDLALHKGYGTTKHQVALKALGPSPIHRMYYKPIRMLTENA